ncbi:MAG: gas vesicle protein K [Bacillota bacterium]|uniref:gas vesicle protein K n=1 Tax=Rossellomorea TaxID=2837508 RepID=UPI0005C8C532|nr:gas vesicle protein K [Rossellomorea aquimaris]
MQQANGTNGRINFDPEKAEQGLAQLVLTVVELLRQIVERHAMRRVEGGTLTDEQVENLGIALMNLEEKMEELKEVFGLDAEDLNIDLGPLGSLM